MCHYFHNYTIEHIDFRGNIPVPVLELVGFQGHLADGGRKGGSFICNRFLEQIKKIDPRKSITDVVMFDGALNLQHAGELLKNHYPNVSVMCGVNTLYPYYSMMFPKSQL